MFVWAVFKLSTPHPFICRNFVFSATQQVTTKPDLDVSLFHLPKVGSNSGGMLFLFFKLPVCVCLCDWVSQSALTPHPGVCVRACIHSAVSLPVNMTNSQEVKCSNELVEWFPQGVVGVNATNYFSGLLSVISHFLQTSCLPYSSWILWHCGGYSSATLFYLKECFVMFYSCVFAHRSRWKQTATSYFHFEEFWLCALSVNHLVC